jgi:organic radical activating enzyme
MTTKRMKRTRTINSFYCSQKFTWLTVDLERRSTYSCCAATPSKIDLSWLEKNPGKLFNTPVLLKERQDMLDNIPVKSCADACWTPESQGLSSRRTMFGTASPTHTLLESQPENLNIVLGSTCNLTCSYCDKQYSSAWLRDVVASPYLDIQKFQITPLDQIVAKISQNEHFHSIGFNLILSELSTFTKLKNIWISGGEPFLYNTFPALLNSVAKNTEVSFHTGLGVDYARLKTQISKINIRDNLTIFVSAENINQLYEFNRYGNSYENFTKNLQLLKDANFKIKFSSVISNLTIYGLLDFANKYGDNIQYQFCNDPNYLQVSVLDPHSKDQLQNSIGSSSIPIKDDIINSLSVNSTEQQRTDCQIFLNEFARRRNLSLDIFPKNMLQWLNTKESKNVVQ